MVERAADVRLTGPGDARRWAQLRDDPAMVVFLQGGARTAHEVFLPGLNAGHYGFTLREIRARMARNIRAALTPARPGEAAMTGDEQFMWRLGFEAVALPAIEAVMAEVNARAAAILGASASVLPLAARTGRRRLRLDDFGALPQPRS